MTSPNFHNLLVTKLKDIKIGKTAKNSENYKVINDFKEDINS